MDDLGVPQPDSQLRILPECGGQSRDEGKYIAGAPELVVETADPAGRSTSAASETTTSAPASWNTSSWPSTPKEVHWHVRRDDKLVRIDPDADGIYRSAVFPGLWLDPAALLRKDLAGVLAVLDRGLATPEHAAFVARLADAAARHTNGA